MNTVTRMKCAALLVSLMATSAWAQEPAPDGAPPALSHASASSPDTITPLPPEKRQGNVTYVSGGVPDEQLPAIKRARGSYPLVIELYQKAGTKSEYTSGAQVKLLDKAGNVVLDDRSEGPFMLVKVRPGTYRLQASLNGKMTDAKSVTVGAKGSKRAVIVFPAGTD